MSTPGRRDRCANAGWRSRGVFTRTRSSGRSPGTKTGETTLAEAGVPAPAESAGPVGMTTASDDQIPGIKLPNSDRFRLSISFLAGYGRDGGNVDKGFERQGRIGYFILSMAGRLNSRTMYLVSINPVNEISPLPACRSPTSFVPTIHSFFMRIYTPLDVVLRSGVTPRERNGRIFTGLLRSTPCLSRECSGRRT